MSHSALSQQSTATIQSAESPTSATPSQSLQSSATIETAESTTAATPAPAARDASLPAVDPAALEVSPPAVVLLVARDVPPPAAVTPAAREVPPPATVTPSEREVPLPAAVTPAAREVSPPTVAVAAEAEMEMEVDDDVPEVPDCIASMIDRSGSVESKRLFLARRTALEMLRDRGYSVPEEEIARTLPDFRAWWGEKSEIERLAFTTTLVSDPSKKVQIVFCPLEPVKIATIREIYRQTEGENLSRLILILQSRILSRAREAIKEIFKFKVDIFQLTELLVNITKHGLKPKHEMLSADQKAKLLKQYNVEDSQLPRMLETDAVARYYGLDKGTVVKVTYDSELTGNHVAYRCVF